MPDQSEEKNNTPELMAKKIETEVKEDENYDGLDELRTEIVKRIEEAKTYFEDNLHACWDTMSNLYRGIRARAAQMLDWQNNFVSGKPFGLAQQIYSSVMAGIYPKEKLFSITPREKTEQNIIIANGWKAAMLVQSKKMHLRRNMGWSVTDGIINDYGILKYGWKFDTKIKKYLDYKTGKVTTVEEPERISTPFIKSVSPFDFLSDLDAMAWEEQGWVAEYVGVTLDEIEGDPTYNMTEEIANLKARLGPDFPRSEVMTAWEYHTNDTVIIIMADGDESGNEIIKKHYTLLKSNEIPYLPFVLFSEQRTPGGIGLLNIMKGSLEYIDKIMNSNADNMDLALRAPWTLKSNSNISFSKLDISLDKIFKVDQNDELQRMNIPGPNLGAYREIELHERFIDGVSGGNQPYDSSTATESKLNALQGSQKVRETIEHNQDELVVPLLTAWLDMNQQFLTPKELVSLVGPGKAREMKLEPAGLDYNIGLDVELSGLSSEIERLTEVDNLSQFTNLATAISQLPPDLQGGMLEELVNLFGYSDKIKMAPEQGQPDEQKLLSIKQEIETVAKEQGVKPEDFMNGLAEKKQMTPEDLMKAVIGAGSLKQFLGGSQ